MPKQLEVTPKIASLIAAVAPDVDPATLAVYETISINSLPVRKNGLFNGAVHTHTTLKEMEAAANDPANHVPLHLVHDQSDGGLPVGKTFHAALTDQNGVSELRSLFYIPKTEADLIAKLEADVISEVSIGARYKHMNCSECGFDYFGDDASIDNFYSGTCANDHEIGVDGVHLMLNGLDRWLEQSLVSLGAARGAKIQGRTKSLLGKDAYNQLAAHGVDPSLTTLFASATPKEPPTMDLTQLVKELTDAKVLVAKHEGTIATLTADRDALKLTADKLPAVEAKLSETQAKLTAAEGGDAAKAQLTATQATEFVRKEAKRIAVALGADTATLDGADLAALQLSIETNRPLLADRFTVGGRANPQGAGNGVTKTPAKAGSFRTV